MFPFSSVALVFFDGKSSAWNSVKFEFLFHGLMWMLGDTNKISSFGNTVAGLSQKHQRNIKRSQGSKFLFVFYPIHKQLHIQKDIWLQLKLTISKRVQTLKRY